MLCVNNYTQAYIDECRAKVAAQVASYKTLVETAKGQAKANGPLLDAAIDAFEPNFFNNMVVTMDSYFVHRARAAEKKDGNPLNEVRMLVNSMMNGNNTMTADKTIKFVPEKSVLKYGIGDEIKVKEADFTQLAAAFFAEIESKYL